MMVLLDSDNIQVLSTVTRGVMTFFMIFGLFCALMLSIYILSILHYVCEKRNSLNTPLVLASIPE